MSAGPQIGDIPLNSLPPNADIRIVHISDTHNRHDQVTPDLLSIEADILIHTGDFCDTGSDEEFESFNRWVGEIKGRYSHGVYVVLGNHDYKFLDSLSLSDDMIDVMAVDEKRREYMSSKIPNAIVLDNEIRFLQIQSGERNLTLSLYSSPWNPFQSSPTHPDRVNGGYAKTDHDRVFQKWSETVPLDQKRNWTGNEAWRYDEIPDKIDILLTHIPPLGVFDKQPWFSNWGSSSPLLTVLKRVTPRMHLFGHVHAQRGYWERVEQDAKSRIVGGVQYAATTHENERDELMKEQREGLEDKIQLMANTAMMSDRTVQLFAKKKIAGKPRVIYGYWEEKSQGSHEGGKWYFRGAGGGPK